VFLYQFACQPHLGFNTRRFGRVDLHCS
jgi:hypothetical protein